MFWHLIKVILRLTTIKCKDINLTLYRLCNKCDNDTLQLTNFKFFKIILIFLPLIMLSKTYVHASWSYSVDQICLCEYNFIRKTGFKNSFNHPYFQFYIRKDRAFLTTIHHYNHHYNASSSFSSTTPPFPISKFSVPFQCRIKI